MYIDKSEKLIIYICSGVTSLCTVTIIDCTGKYDDDDEKVWLIIMIMNCILFLCHGRKNNWYNELFMIISLSTQRLEATCWQLLLSHLQPFQQRNWRSEMFIFSLYFNSFSDLINEFQCRALLLQLFFLPRCLLEI